MSDNTFRDDNLRDETLRDDTTGAGSMSDDGLGNDTLGTGSMSGGSMASDGLGGDAGATAMDGTSAVDRTWAYRDEGWADSGRDVVGYSVEATDGSIGKIDEASSDASGSHVVVDTGPWIFGTKRLVPAGAISDVDHDSGTVRVGMTKDQIKSAPEYQAESWGDDARTEHEDYYRGYSRVDDDPRNPL